MVEQETCIDSQGRTIDLLFDEVNLSVTAKDGAVVIGTFQFREVDEDNSLVLLLTHCHLEKVAGYRRCGIGTAIVNFVRSYGYAILMRHDDGVRHSDGSYLSGDGSAFAAALVERKLISRF